MGQTFVARGVIETEVEEPPVADETRLCASCEAFKQDPANEGQGWCHFYPPTMLLRAPVASQPTMNPEPCWPEVAVTDWCLQWERATTS